MGATKPLGRTPALVLTWAGLSVLMVAMYWRALAAHSFADADDMMRLMEVRDWLGGQSWFDTTQYRIGPSGLPMHWSRLLDVPLGLVLLLLRPLLGVSAAEAATAAVVPLLTLAVAIAATALIVRRLIGPAVAPAVLGAALMISAPMVFVQIHPSRIDHHGWQIAIAGLALGCLLDPRPARGGLLAGLATALYLNISLEGLPFAAAAAATLGIQWAFGRDVPERLTAYLGGLAVGSATALGLVAPGLRWSIAWCDVVLPQHVLAFAVAAAGTAGAVRFGQPRGPVVRLLLLGVAGAAAAAMLGATAPRCLAGPFNMLGPLSSRLWMANVNEGLPLWRVGASERFTIIGFPMVGLIGTIAAWRRTDDAEARRRWMLTLALLAATTLTGVLMHRAAGLPHLIAVPGALALIEPLRRRAIASGSAVVRVVGATLAIVILSPLMQVYLAVAVSPADAATPKREAGACDEQCGLRNISRLPPGRVFTAIDIGPSLLMVSRDTIYSAAYHRSGAPMENTLRAFTGTPDTARAIVASSGADYLLIAPDSAEAKVYARYAPRGFMARLVHGEVPAWLRPIKTGTHDISFYRVIRGDATGGAGRSQA